MPMNEGYPKVVQFESHGVHKGRSFKAGAHYVLRGLLEVQVADPDQEALVMRGLADFCVYPVGTEVPAHVLEHEKNLPPVEGAPNESLAHLKPPFGGEWPEGSPAPPPAVASAPAKKGGKKGPGDDLPGAVS